MNCFNKPNLQGPTRVVKVFLRLVPALFVISFCIQQSVAQEITRVRIEDVPATDGWRSFRGGGSSNVEQAARLPVSWSPEKGISWQVELPGYGQSSPIVIADKVLLTAVEGPQRNNNLVVCLDRRSGEELWTFEQSTTRQGPSNFMFSRAAPTPVVDDDCVYAFFESGDMIALRLDDGEKVWELDLKTKVGQFKTNHGLGSSLAQTDEHLFVNLEHNGPSALLAIQKADGHIQWRTERPSGSSWSSPVVFRRGEQTQIVVSSAGEAAGYDAVTGEPLWKVDGLAGNSVPSPLVVDNQIILGARKPEFGSTETAAKSNLCLEFKDDEVTPSVAWRSERCIADYSSPVVCGNYVFLINGSGILGCLDRETGAEIYRQRLGFECWATPIVNGDHLYIFGKNGATTVVKAKGVFSPVSENRLWDRNDPPKPVSYQEHFPQADARNAHRAGGHGAGHGGGQHGTHAAESTQKDGSRKPGSGMLAGLMKNDADGDGTLSGDEIPRRLSAVMSNIDLNGNGKLEEDEMKKMAESFAEKRKGSRQSSRDPIVYGVAADAHGILIRTGTRLYAIGNGEEE